jgi:plastocyanin
MPMIIFTDTMTRKTAARAARVLGLLLSLSAWGDPSAPASAQAATIAVKDFSFQPQALTIKAGTTVTWTNLDDEPHTVRSDTGLFRSGALDGNERFSFTFDKPGTYRFTCSIHPHMTGTIVVQ